MSSVSIIADLVRPIITKQLGQTQGMIQFDDWWDLHRSDCIKNWYYYFGKQALFIRKREAENDQDYLRRVGNATIENELRSIIDLIASYLYEEDSPKRFVHRGDDVDDTLQKWFKETVWSYQNVCEFDDLKALNALVTGFSVIQRQLIDIRTDKPMSAIESAISKSKYGVIQKRLLDSCFTAALPYMDENGIIYPNKLGAVLYMADQDNFLGNATLMKLLNKPIQTFKVLEYVDDKVWLQWKLENGKGWIQQTVNAGTPFENKNQFGNVNIPFSLFSNTGDPFLVEGESELSDLKPIQLELNELGTGERDVITYHQDPILFGKNIDLPNPFIRKPNMAVSAQGKDVDLEYIVWNGQLEGSQNRVKKLQQSLSSISQIGMLSRGFLSEMGQIRSGPPLKAMFTSERSKMNRKFKVFKGAEERDMRADVRFWDTSIGATSRISKDISFHAQFNKDFLGIDALLNKEIEVLGLQGGADDIKENLYIQYPDRTEAEIDAIYQRIMKSRQSKQATTLSKSSQRSEMTQTSSSAQ